MTKPTQPPVLVVHGIWDTKQRVRPLTHGLIARGLPHVHAFTLQPNDGHAPIEVLAQQTALEAEDLRLRHGVKRIDIVGFSMGALIARYYLQRLDGSSRVRRFVSISGPHHGTVTAHALPWPAVRQMRPGSTLLTDLGADRDPWGRVEVHCIYTPFDLMIVPAHSSRLPFARGVHRVPVVLHRLMVRDQRVLDLTAQLLCASG